MTNGASLNDQYIRTLTLIKARSLMKSPAFRGVERDDVLRDLTLILAKRLDQFDPERAQLRTFVSGVLDSAAITLLRARQREKRSGDHGMAPIERLRESQTTDPVTGSAAVGEADAARRLGREVRSPIDEFHLNDSIREIVAALPPDLATCGPDRGAVLHGGFGGASHRRGPAGSAIGVARLAGGGGGKRPRAAGGGPARDPGRGPVALSLRFAPGAAVPSFADPAATDGVPVDVAR